MTNTPTALQSKPPITLEVYLDIKSKIVRLELMPGQILMMQQLSKDLGISRTPVREAVVRLCDEGLVEESSGRKFRVSHITWKMIDDIYETRQAFEGIALQVLAQSIRPEQLDMLDEIVRKMKGLLEEMNAMAYFEADDAFHHTLLALHGNQVMLSCMERIKDQQQRIRFLTMGIRGRMQESIKEHEHIVDCLRQANAIGALKELKQHLELAKGEVKQLLQTSYPKSLVRE